jgi:hypothetical protein
VKARRSQAYEEVAGLDPRAVDELLFFHDADGKAREVIFALAVERRHFSGLAADERAARLFAARGDALDDVRMLLRFEPARGEIIKEEERLGALDDDVVHAHGHEVDADRVVPVHEEGDLELGAHAVGARDEHRGLVFLEREEPSEPADVRHDLGPERGFDVGFYLLDEEVAGVDVDARVFVGYGHALSLLIFSGDSTRNRGGCQQR